MEGAQCHTLGRMHIGIEVTAAAGEDAPGEQEPEEQEPMLPRSSKPNLPPALDTHLGA